MSQGLFGSDCKPINSLNPIIIPGRVWVESNQIWIGSGQVNPLLRSKMNVTRQPEPDSFIRVWVRGYSGRVVIGSTRLTRILFGSGMGLA